MEHTESPTERMWRTFKEELMAYLRRRLPTADDAEDVLQDIFHRIHRSTERLGEVGSVRAWLYGIARNAVADFYRKSRKSAVHVSLDRESDVAADSRSESEPGVGTFSGSHDVHEEVLSWLEPTIAELPEMYAVPLRMADIEGRSQQDVADVLGLSLSGAKSRIQRGRVLLGESLRRCCEIEFGAEGRAVEFRRLQPATDECSAGSCA